MKVNIGSIQYDLKMKDKLFEDGQRFRGTLEEYNWLIEISKEFTKELISDGYDGVYYNGNMRGETVVFEPEQIWEIFDVEN